MPRPKAPLTPSASAEPSAQEKMMEGSFSLPPAAVNNRSPPISPNLQRKRTLSGTTKKPEELPPPPSRARKIIQMKPQSTDAPPAPSVSALAPTSSTTTITTATPSPRQRKPPSATSAAGRKIARKTAHSIIERRRRSKMNEEFGVLKDMIPACDGVEMHKLAILQAGIEYVKYLQGCVEKLQANQAIMSDRDEVMSDARPSQRPTPDDMSSGSIYRPSPPAINSTYASPAIRPNHNNTTTNQVSPRHHPTSHQQANAYSTSPPPLFVQTPTTTGVSPAFNAIHFSPDLARNSVYTSQYPASIVGKPSPSILPLPQAAMPFGNGPERQLSEGAVAEATATAALVMMSTDDRRVAVRSGMSVKDLLSS